MSGLSFPWAPPPRGPPTPRREIKTKRVPPAPHLGPHDALDRWGTCPIDEAVPREGVRHLVFERYPQLRLRLRPVETTGQAVVPRHMQVHRRHGRR